MRQFNFMLLGVAVLGALAVLPRIYSYRRHARKSGPPEQVSGSETAKLDKQIEEIKKLKEQTQALCLVKAL